MRRPRLSISIMNPRAWILCLVILCSILCYIEFDAMSKHARLDNPAHLRRLQRDLQGTNDDDGISLRQTILPTLILTPAPTSPTGIPSSSPSDFPTIFSEAPSDPPSTSPSEQPSTSLSPSQNPSLSLQPTLSQGPSYSPSVMPSRTPTKLPTKSPTTVPSAEPSSLPTPSPSFTPTASVKPSMQPSFVPTNSPTLSSRPSQVPSISAVPTTTREPTNVPSTAPTLYPTLSPSVVPTPLPPTHSPSDLPSQLPSVSPSLAPSFIPTVFPTLSVFPLVAPSITMVLVGFPARLSAIEREEWENMTSAHVLRFYQKFNEIDRGVIPVNVTNVTTVFLRQIYQPEDERLEIEYEQSLVLGKFRETEDDEGLFVAPFVENTQDYVIDLLTTWDLDNLIALRSVVVGKAGRMQPPAPPDDSGISSGELAALAVSIVLGACAVVAFLFWDKKGKLHFRRWNQPPSPIREGAQGSQSHDRTNGDHEGVQNPQGWRNGVGDGTFGSQGWTNAQLRTPPRYDSSTMPTASIRSVDGGSMIDPMSVTTGSHHGRLQSRNTIAPISMRPGVFGRDRDESEITVTDSDGGHASDTGSDAYVIDPPILPSIADVSESFLPGENIGALSPMHIPDEEDENADHEYQSSQEMLGLAGPNAALPELGFSMKIHDLE